MSKSEKIFLSLLSVILAFVVIGVIALSRLPSSSQSFGSVTVGNEYRSYMASSTSASANTAILLKNRPGALGSVIIQTTTSGSYFKLYDSATTTPGSATTSSATIASFPISAVAGTYTFDETFNNGLVLEVPTGFTGIYTVTYR